MLRKDFVPKQITRHFVIDCFSIFISIPLCCLKQQSHTEPVENPSEVLDTTANENEEGKCDNEILNENLKKNSNENLNENSNENSNEDSNENSVKDSENKHSDVDLHEQEKDISTDEQPLLETTVGLFTFLVLCAFL